MELESIIGYTAASLTTLSFLPQAIRVIMTKKNGRYFPKYVSTFKCGHLSLADLWNSKK